MREKGQGTMRAWKEKPSKWVEDEGSCGKGE